MRKKNREKRIFNLNQSSELRINWCTWTFYSEDMKIWVPNMINFREIDFSRNFYSHFVLKIFIFILLC